MCCVPKTPIRLPGLAPAGGGSHFICNIPSQMTNSLQQYGLGRSAASDCVGIKGQGVVPSPLLPQTTLMEITPLFDVSASLWVAEVGDQEFCAESLRELQVKLPDAQFQGYYPNGFVATRDGFLKDLGRVPFFTSHLVSKQKQRQIDRYRQASMEGTAVATPAAIVSAFREPKPPASAHEEIMNLTVKGLRSPVIAERLGLTLATVQRHRMIAYRDNDPRAIPLPKRMIVRSGSPNHLWTEQDDTLLRKLAAEGLTSFQIAEQIGCTRNAVIGRVHRKGIQLCSVYRGRPKRVNFS